MQQGPPDPNRPASTQEQEATSQGAKRSRQSSYTTESTEAGPSDAPSKHPRPLNPSTPSQRGTTRDTADMYRASTPPEVSGSGSIKYTRTGRVSKATKGQRVHNCEECGKTYTRAEHLRRHQQNHKPGAFPCDMPGCNRSFYREDLLIRHKARHNDPRNPPSRRQSIGSVSSAHEGGLAASDSTSSAVPSNPSEVATASESSAPVPSRDAQQPSEPSRAPKRLPIPPYELPLGGVPIAIEGTTGYAHFVNPWSRTSLSPGINNEYDYESSDDYSGAFYHPPGRGRYSSDASLVGYSQPHSSSRSPVSVGSSIMYPAQWTSTASLGQDLNSCMLNSLTLPYSEPQYLGGLMYGNIQPTMAEQRDLLERVELELPGTSSFELEGSVGMEYSNMHDHSRYVPAYWTILHELYPVLHRPTFDIDTTSPLLRAAVLALGAQALGERADLINARMLHERCMKVLKQRTIKDTHTYRVCDMQAIFLVKLFSLFKSRRPPLEFSGDFEEIFRRLENDPDATSRAITEPIPETFSQLASGQYSIYAECKRRLLLACFLLEQQCNSLFGRASALGFPGIWNALPFPLSQTTWDNPLEYQSDIPPFERISDALHALRYNMLPPTQQFDTFQSSLIIAVDTSRDDSRNNYDLPASLPLDQSSRGKLIHHTALLLQNMSDLRALLAVAGESWVMSEKLVTPSDYLEAQIKVRSWAANSSTVQDALVHALAILSIHRATPKTGLLYQEWSVYLATLVIWARGYVCLEEKRTAGPASTPSAFELERGIGRILSSGEVREWKQVQSLLLWTKGKLEEQFAVPHTCGLVSGALDVLGKLVRRGVEAGWM